MKTRDVFGSFALSCKRFNNLTKDSRAIKFLHLKRIKTWESFGKMMKVAKNSKNLIELQIDEFWRESHIAFYHFKNHNETNPKLKLLKIGDFIGYSEYECFQKSKVPRYRKLEKKRQDEDDHVYHCSKIVCPICF